MQAQLENVSGLERRLSVTVPVAEIDAEVDTRLRNLAKTVKMHGFRPGKVPFRVVQQQYSGQVRQEVLLQHLPEGAPRLRRADRVDAQRQLVRGESQLAVERELEVDQLGVRRRRVGADRLDAELVQRAVAPGLGAVVAEERAEVAQAHRLRPAGHAVLDVGAADGGGPLRAQRQGGGGLVPCEAVFAGALGRPVWALIPFQPDWRWGLAGNATSWYPGMELFRQPEPGDWTNVINQMTEKLASAGAPVP